MNKAHSIELRLLGGWKLNFHGVSPVVGSRQQRLIAALAIYGRRSRSVFGGLLWPDCTETHAMGSLRTAVFTVSQQLPGVLAICGRDLDLGESVDVDLHRLRSTLDSFTEPVAVESWHTNTHDIDLLPGWYDDWVVAEQEHLQNRYLNAAERLAESALGRNDHYTAVHLAQTVLELDPLRESAVRILVKTHIAAGNRAPALRLFRQYMDRLSSELSIRPSQQLLTLVAPFLHHEAPNRHNGSSR
jgi:SARP family transcriptional regulator, regulator of embCAB operon